MNETFDYAVHNSQMYGHFEFNNYLIKYCLPWSQSEEVLEL